MVIEVKKKYKKIILVVVTHLYHFKIRNIKSYAQIIIRIIFYEPIIVGLDLYLYG